jgi:hypothetical protein
VANKTLWLKKDFAEIGDSPVLIEIYPGMDKKAFCVL